MSKLVGVLGGGDWTDASVTHLVIPDDMDLSQQKINYNRWYKNVYVPSLREPSKRCENFYSFTQWLIKNGARDATEDDILIYFDD